MPMSLTCIVRIVYRVCRVLHAMLYGFPFPLRHFHDGCGMSDACMSDCSRDARCALSRPHCVYADFEAAAALPGLCHPLDLVPRVPHDGDRCGAVRCGAVRCGAVRCGQRPATSDVNMHVQRTTCSMQQTPCHMQRATDSCRAKTRCVALQGTARLCCGTTTAMGGTGSRRSLRSLGRTLTLTTDNATSQHSLFRSAPVPTVPKAAAAVVLQSSSCGGALP